VREERLEKGQTALMVGFGASFTIGSAMLVFTGVGGKAAGAETDEPVSVGA
jgi:hypothetical protein